jgi:hypothetical protein
MKFPLPKEKEKEKFATTQQPSHAGLAQKRKCSSNASIEISITAK